MIASRENRRELTAQMSRRCWSTVDGGQPYIHMTRHVNVAATLVVAGAVVSRVDMSFVHLTGSWSFERCVLEYSVDVPEFAGPIAVANAVERARKTVLAVRDL